MINIDWKKEQFSQVEYCSVLPASRFWEARTPRKYTQTVRLQF